MTYFHALLLSIVEGLTEFLPVSSTGHLILVSKLLSVPQSEFLKSFEIIIQLGTILAVVFLYKSMLLHSSGVWTRIIVAFIPTGIIGLVFYKFIKYYLIGNETVTLFALFIGGILLIFIEYFHKDNKTEIKTLDAISLKNALLIGLFQSIAVIPGVSRAAATIMGARMLGVKRENAVVFSFLLAIPTMTAATGYDLLKNSFTFTQAEFGLLLVGFVGSFIVAIIAVKFFLRFAQNHTFIPFGIYRIILAIVYWMFVVK